MATVQCKDLEKVKAVSAVSSYLMAEPPFCHETELSTSNSSSCSQSSRCKRPREDAAAGCGGGGKNGGGSRRSDLKHPSYVGVRMRAWGKWVSEIREPKKKSRIWLGTFATPEMAARAHDVAAMSIKGESAVLNFPTLAGLLPRAVTCTPRDVQAAAVKAAHMDHLDPPKPASSSSASLVSSPSSSSLVSTVTSGEDASTPPQEEEDEAAPPSPAELGEIVELPELQDTTEPTRDEFIFVDSYGWDFCHPWSHIDDDCGLFYATAVAGQGFDAVLSGDFDSCLWQH